MIHLNIFIAAAAIITFAGCSRKIQEAIPEKEEERITLTAKFCQASEEMQTMGTKTRLENSTSVVWSNDDEISLFNQNSAHYKFSLTNGAGTEKAKFEGTVGSRKPPYYLIYPYNSANTKKKSDVVGYAVNFPLAQTRKYVYQSFENGANVMYATINELDENVEFKNVCGLLRLDIVGKCRISRIELRDLGGAMLWGDVSLALANGGTDSQKLSVANGSDTVYLDVESEKGGLDLTGRTDCAFYFVLPPGALANGFKADVYDGVNLLKSFRSDKPHTVRRGVVTRMAGISMDDTPVPALLINEKSIFANLPKGTTCSGITSTKDESGNPSDFIVAFSNGTTYNLDRKRAALVTVGGYNGHEMNNRHWYINAIQQNYEFISDSPYYTVGANGNWYCDGSDTKTRAVPENADASKYENYVTSIIKMPTFIEVLISDGSRFEFERTDRVYDMYVSKTATEMDVYIANHGSDKYIKYPLIKRYKAYAAGVYPSFYDNWGIMLPVQCSKSGNSFTKILDLFLGGESECTCRTEDPSGEFVASGGSTHGFEQMTSTGGVRDIVFEVDGEELTENAVFSLKQASRIKVTMNTELYNPYTNTNPYAGVTKVWLFENGKLYISIRYRFLKETKVNVGKFGMICCKRLVTAKDTSSGYITRLAVKNNRPAYSVNVEEGWSNYNLTQIDYNCSRITEYGDKGLFFALVVDNPVGLPGSGMFVTTNGNNYNKIYYEVFGKSSVILTMAEGQVIEGSVHWEIEEY